MYAALGIVGQRKLLVAGIYNCMGPLASKCSSSSLVLGVNIDTESRSYLHRLHDRQNR
jgi:hypothetical protein